MEEITKDQLILILRTIKFVLYVKAQNKILSQTEKKKIFMPDMTEKELIFFKKIFKTIRLLINDSNSSKYLYDTMCQGPFCFTHTYSFNPCEQLYDKNTIIIPI